jgi:hypothetical protein
MGREIRQRHIIVLSSVTNFLGTAALAVAGWYGWSDYDRNAIILLGVGVLFLAVTPAAISLFTVRSEARSAEIQERHRALAMFTEITHSLFKMADAHDLRVTLMGVNKNHNPPILEQIVRCTNKGQQTTGSSTMTISQGVAGRCYREPRIATANFAVGDFVQHMVDLGFTKQEARQFERRGAYLCAPIVGPGGEVIAVLSMDAKNPNVFQPDHTEIAEWVTPFFAKFLTVPERGEA